MLILPDFNTVAKKIGHISKKKWHTHLISFHSLYLGFPTYHRFRSAHLKKKNSSKAQDLCHFGGRTRRRKPRQGSHQDITRQQEGQKHHQDSPDFLRNLHQFFIHLLDSTPWKWPTSNALRMMYIHWFFFGMESLWDHCYLTSGIFGGVNFVYSMSINIHLGHWGNLPRMTIKRMKAVG